MARQTSFNRTEEALWGARGVFCTLADVTGRAVGFHIAINSFPCQIPVKDGSDHLGLSLMTCEVMCGVQHEDVGALGGHNTLSVE